MKKNISKILVLVVLLTSFSCQRAEKDQSTKLTLNIPADLGSKPITSSSLNSNIIPSSLSDINCFAVLVTGSESGMSRNTCHYKTSGDAFAVGKIYGGFFKSSAANASMTVEVPNGLKRIIRLIGFKVDTTAAATASSTYTGNLICSNFLNNDALQKFISDPYILKEQPDVDMKGDPLTLDITATLDTNFKVGDCKGPDFPSDTGGSSGGAPSRFGLAFQDYAGTSIATPLTYSNCVGLRIQIQDSNGNRADLSTNPTIIGKVNAGSSVGTFYQPNPSTGYACDAVSAITPNGNQEIEFTFKDGAAAFSDIVMFYKPSTPFTAAGVGTLTVQAATSSPVVLQGGSLTFSATTTPSSAAKYAFYDMYGNKSTASATSSGSRITVPVNECRVGFLQFLDTNGLPLGKYFASGPDPIYIAPSTSNTSFYANSSDCSNGVSSTPSKTISISSGITAGGVSFYYKVTSATSNFGYSITNIGTTSPAVVSGDLSSGSNYWEAK